MPGLILHPDGARLRRRIDELRRQLSRLFDERLRLEYQVLPPLRDRHDALFGDLERVVQLRTLEMSERRRIVELIALKLDRGQKLDDRTIDLVIRAVRAEYGRVRARLHARVESRRTKSAERIFFNADHHERVEVGVGEVSRAEEARRLYLALARRLHPDVSSDATETLRTWDLVQKAHRVGDLGLLRTLSIVVQGVGGEIPSDINALEREAARLERGVSTEEAHLAAIHNGELYAMREKFDDPEFVAARRAAMETDIAALEEKIGRCDAFLGSVLKGRRIPPPEELRQAWSSFVEDVYINNR